MLPLTFQYHSSAMNTPSGGEDGGYFTFRGGLGAEALSGIGMGTQLWDGGSSCLRGQCSDCLHHETVPGSHGHSQELDQVGGVKMLKCHFQASPDRVTVAVGLDWLR